MPPSHLRATDAVEKAVKLGTKTTVIYVHRDDLPLLEGKTVRYAERIDGRTQLATVDDVAERLAVAEPILSPGGSHRAIQERTQQAAGDGESEE